MTEETLKNPTAGAHPNPVDLDRSIECLRVSLQDIPWLQKAFHRAKEFAEKTGTAGTVIRVPKVYIKAGEYYPVMPNDSLKSFSFFRVTGGRNLDDYEPHAVSNYATCPVDLIVWGNLKQIDKTKDYIFTEELIRDVLEVLQSNEDVELEGGGIFDERPDDIFSGYTLDVTQRDLLKYPYFAFRIAMSLRYTIDCFNED